MDLLDGLALTVMKDPMSHIEIPSADGDLRMLPERQCLESQVSLWLTLRVCLSADGLLSVGPL